METFVKYASIIPELGIAKALDYGIPEPLIASIKRGALVEVPIRGVLRRGYVFEVKENTSLKRVLPIQRMIAEQELIEEDLFEVALWMAKYYNTPLYLVLRAMLPGSVRNQIESKQQLFIRAAKSRQELRKLCEETRLSFPLQAAVLDVMLQAPKGLFLSELLEKTQGSKSPVETLAKKGYLLVELVKVGASILADEEYFQTKPKQLSQEQVVALQKIYSSLEERRFETHLIYGVTGSGKTEIYMQAIRRVLDAGRSALILVPEIALTAQTVERFKSRFSEPIAVLHHRLSDGERFEEWYKVKRKEVQIVIGARSAIFSPLQDLGLIIVDEEHENSYKQGEEAPSYHARDVAVMRGFLKKATVLLGSATPSLESYYNASSGKYTLSTLSLRASFAKMPQVSIVDMKKEIDRGYRLFSEQLINGIKKRFEMGEQTILFLNRRGYHTTQLCKGCGHTVQCPSCDLNLTFHLGDHLLACHMCGYRTAPCQKCPSCGSMEALKYRGVGTEQVEKALHALLPQLRLLRVDADTTRHKGSHEKLLTQFRTHKADVLIGTQMVSKGLHFPSVTLVGVLNSDSSLNIPDFRASENAFQLITQVSGRAGRGVMAGEVIIQTFLGENRTIQLAAEQNYLGFYHEEIEVRKAFGYPPFSHLIKMNFSGEDLKETFECAKRWYDALREKIPPPFVLHPVIAAGHAKIKDRYRFHLLLAGPSVYFMNEKIHEVTLKMPRSVRLYIDVDPLSTL